MQSSSVNTLMSHAVTVSPGASHAQLTVKKAPHWTHRREHAVNASLLIAEAWPPDAPSTVWRISAGAESMSFPLAMVSTPS